MEQAKYNVWFVITVDADGLVYQSISSHRDEYTLMYSQLIMGY